MMTVVRDMTVGDMTFGSGWVSTYEDCVHWRRIIATDLVECS